MGGKKEPGNRNNYKEQVPDSGNQNKELFPDLGNQTKSGCLPRIFAPFVDGLKGGCLSKLFLLILPFIAIGAVIVLGF
jgi:hypothetical protein